VRQKETAMVRAAYSKLVHRNLIEHSLPAQRTDSISLGWSHAKIRKACLVLAGAAMTAAVFFAVSPPFVRWLCFVWLLGIAFLIHRLNRRAATDTVVLSIDRRGILDQRLMPRHIEWHEIEAVCPTDIDRGHVVDIRFRWPTLTLAQARWPAGLGAYCQRGHGIPAITISVLLLEGNVSDILDAIAQHRADLLHPTNRPGRATEACCAGSE
jgi:hypothetical protein